MRTHAGLPQFFTFMNTRKPGEWTLVGGAAAWLYIARAPRDMSQDVEVYRRVFPDDIDVLIVGDPPDADEHEVALGAMGNKAVQWVHSYAPANDRAQCESAVVFDHGGRAIPIGQIVFKYSQTSDKQKVRRTRVELLQLIAKGLEISPDEALRFYESTDDRAPNPFQLALQSKAKK